jgi:hypothetical protein
MVGTKESLPFQPAHSLTHNPTLARDCTAVAQPGRKKREKRKEEKKTKGRIV